MMLAQPFLKPSRTTISQLGNNGAIRKVVKAVITAVTIKTADRSGTVSVAVIMKRTTARSQIITYITTLMLARTLRKALGYGVYIIRIEMTQTNMNTSVRHQTVALNNGGLRIILVAMNVYAVHTVKIAMIQ